MKFYTQSQLAPYGNCWQTAIACILEVEPDTLPPQSEIERWNRKALTGWGSYHNCLEGYLRTHHGLAYTTIYSCQFAGVQPVRPEHIMCGPTVRTPTTGCNHCVVGVNGHPVWDVHPSRDGLTSVNDWGLLQVWTPPQSKQDIERQAKLRDDEIHQLVFGCLCPIHNLEAARKRAATLPEKVANESQT